MYPLTHNFHLDDAKDSKNKPRRAMVQLTILKIFNRMMNRAVASDSEWLSNKLETLNGGLASAETVIKLDETVY